MAQVDPPRSRDSHGETRLRIGRMRSLARRVPAAPAHPRVGDQPWFDIPARLLVFVLGVVHLVLHPIFVEAGTLWIVLAVYGGATLVALLGLTPPVQALIRRLGFQEGIDEAEPGILNFLLDAAFVVGITILDPTSVLLPAAMVLVTAARFFARNTGRSTSLILFPFGLAILVLGVRHGAPWSTPSDPAVLVSETTLMILLLAVLFRVMRTLNRDLPALANRGAGGVDATPPGAAPPPDPDPDTRRLEEQVLRLTVLQDGMTAMNSAMDLNDLLQMVVTNAVRVLKADQSSIGLLDEETGELVIQAATMSGLGLRRFSRGAGVAGWVVQHGEPLKVDDVRQDPRYLQPNSAEYTGAATRSILCVPLKVERRVIGALTVTHAQPGALTTDDLRLLTSFAEQASLAVYKTQLLAERTRQSEELRRRGELIASLMSVRQSVLSSLDLAQVLDTTLSRIRELIHFDYGAIYLLHPRTGEPELAASTGDGTAYPEELALRPGTGAWALWERARVSGPAAACGGDRCALNIPLMQRGNALGCIVLTRGAASPFSEAERDTAEQLAETATVAVDNARLFSSRSIQQQQATALYRLMIQVSEATSRRALSLVICTEIQKISNARAVGLLINEPEQGRFVGWATCGEWQDNLQVQNVMLGGQGDPFVRNILTVLQQREVAELLIFPGAPPQWHAAFGDAPCITIPMTLGRRIYGLLILLPGSDPAINSDSKETVNLAISHCTVALERAELFEQTLGAARQAGTLHKMATEVQASLDLATVVQTTAASCVTALPIESCEVYILDADRRYLLRSGMDVRPGVEQTGWMSGPASIAVRDSVVALEVLRSPGLVAGDILPGTPGAEEGHRPEVVLGRLLGSGEALGIVRLTTALPAAEFVRRHATFCQTLWMHAGGALERSFLYTTAANQAALLRRRTQHLADILDLGNLSTADVPVTTLLPQLAAGIARSVGFAYAEIGAVGLDGGAVEWYLGEGTPGLLLPPGAHPAVPPAALDWLLTSGRTPRPDFKGVYVDEALLAQVLPEPRSLTALSPAPLILLPLQSSAGEPLGFLLAAPAGRIQPADSAAEDELLEVLSIFAQRVALYLENQRIYSQLLTSKRNIETVVLSISDGVIVTDADLNILITNSLADQLLSVPTTTSRGQCVEHFIHNAALLHQIQECLETAKPSTADVDFQVGRELRTYQAIVHSITPPEGGSLGVVLTLRDVTLERATERSKSDFLSVVSHELRTPLNSIMAFLDIILMGKTGALNELQTDFLGTAKQESVALQRLIDDLLDYTRIQSRMLRLEMVPMDLSAAISRLGQKVAPQIMQENLRFLNNVPPEVLVIGDEVRLEQVFKNLVDNAIKFSSPEGLISVDATISATSVVVRVKDTGAGIPPAQLSMVFERFFQAENRPERRKPGLGLGLAICKNIVEAHGGRIWIESDPGEGTSVYVELALFRPTEDAETTEFQLDLDSPMLALLGDPGSLAGQVGR
jgi:signal transduction histidine kinase/putative methionine-R-sulfoxide reductase with GAF domain